MGAAQKPGWGFSGKSTVSGPGCQQAISSLCSGTEKHLLHILEVNTNGLSRDKTIIPTAHK
jgi:hypothetical protein